MTRLLAVPLDESDVFLMTFMILQDSYMEPTRVGSDVSVYPMCCMYSVYSIAIHTISMLHIHIDVYYMLYLYFVLLL